MAATYDLHVCVVCEDPNAEDMRRERFRELGRKAAAQINKTVCDIIASRATDSSESP